MPEMIKNKMPHKAAKVGIIMKKLCLTLAVIFVFAAAAVSFTSCSTKYEVVMEYNGIKLTEDKYYYWLTTYKRNILSSYSDAYDTEDFWQAQYDENTTVEEYFTSILNQQIMNYLIAQSIFKENKLTLSAEVKSAISADINEKIEYYGSRAELNAELKNLMLNINSLKEVYTWEEKYNVVSYYLFGEGGTDEVTDGEIINYYAKNYSRLKYIVFYTTKIATDEKGNYVYDDSGNIVTEKMTEDELAQKQAEITECLEKLGNGSSFDEVREKYSEYDTSSYPSGFYVSANELDIWGKDIVLGVADASVGDIFRVDEEEAVYIILKCQLPQFTDLTDSDIEQLSNLSSYATRELCAAKFKALSEGVIVNSDILARYKLSDIKANPYYSI